MNKLIDVPQTEMQESPLKLDQMASTAGLIKEPVII